MHVYIDHCAILVNNIEEFSSKISTDCHHGKIHTFASEGTREQYISLPQSKIASVLLMQPNGEGPYLRAMNKRGPGLHHICIRVDSVSEFVQEHAQSGFLLHPSSLQTFNHGVVYLCRPGIPFLLEVENLTDEQREIHGNEGLVEAIGLKLGQKELQIVQSLLGNFIFANDTSALKLNGSHGGTISL